MEESARIAHTSARRALSTLALELRADFGSDSLADLHEEIANNLSSAEAD